MLLLPIRRILIIIEVIVVVWLRYLLALSPSKPTKYDMDVANQRLLISKYSEN